MVTAKNASAQKIGNLVADLTQWVACFTASLQTDANPLGDKRGGGNGSGSKFYFDLFCGFDFLEF